MQNTHANKIAIPNSGLVKWVVPAIGIICSMTKVWLLTVMVYQVNPDIKAPNHRLLDFEMGVMP